MARGLAPYRRLWPGRGVGWGVVAAGVCALLEFCISVGAVVLSHTSSIVRSGVAAFLLLTGLFVCKRKILCSCIRGTAGSCPRPAFAVCV